MKMFFVLNGLVNGDWDHPAVRKFSEKPEETLEDGWWIAPDSSGSSVITLARGPYLNSKQATAAIGFLKLYDADASVVQMIESHCAKRGIKPDEYEEVISILMTLVTELVEVQGIGKDRIADVLTDWDQRMADPDSIAEYIF